MEPPVRRRSAQPAQNRRSGPIVASIVVLALIAGIAALVISRHSNQVGGVVSVYYTKMDGTSMGTFTVSQRPAAKGESATEHLHDVALYAAVSALAGPPGGTEAIRFPPGTRVQGVTVQGSTATVDLSREITRQAGGSFGEDGEFKALVYTLTGVPGIDAVKITIDGATLPTLPGGHVELDQPLHRSDW
ncbi:MAG: GerMN domain-containing protein [Candidatus Tumulicola sp.]